MRSRFIALLVAAVGLVGLLAVACGGSESAAGSATESGGLSTQALAALLAEGDSPSGISVSGRGIAVAVPDIASLSLGISTVGDSARQARGEAASLMADLIASLDENGIAEEDYHTSSFSINPEIDHRPNGEQVIRGYRVTSTLAVTVRDLDRVGEVIDDAVDAVGDPIRVQGVSFSIEDPAALQSEARALAMADAKAKAEELAALADLGLGKPTAISESSGGGLPPVFFGVTELAQDVETSITPGQLEITVNVQVRYAID